MGLFGGKASKAKEVVREARMPMLEGLELVEVYITLLNSDKGMADKAMGFLAQYMALDETCTRLLTKSTKPELLRLTADAETFRFNVYKTISEAMPEGEGKVLREIGLSKRRVPPRVLTAEKALEDAKKGLAKVHEHKDIFYVMDYSTLLIEYNMIMTRCNEVITGRPTTLNANTLVKEVAKYRKDVDTAVAQAKERVAKIPMDKDPKLAGDSKYIAKDPEAPTEWQESTETLVQKAAEIANKGQVLFQQNAKLLGTRYQELYGRYKGLADRAKSITELKENATEGGKRLVGDSICFLAAVQKGIADAKREHLEKTGKIKKPVKPEVEPSTGVKELDHVLYILSRTKKYLGSEYGTFRAKVNELKEKKDDKEIKQLLADVALAASKALRSLITGTPSAAEPAKANGNGSYAEPEPAIENGSASNGIAEVPKEDKGKGKDTAVATASTSTSNMPTNTLPTCPPAIVTKDREDSAALLFVDGLLLLNNFSKKLSKADVEKLEKVAAGLEGRFSKPSDEKFVKDARAFKESVTTATVTARQEMIQRQIDNGIKRLTSKFTFPDNPVLQQAIAQMYPTAAQPPSQAAAPSPTISAAA